MKQRASQTGEAGIRTLGTLLRYNALAKRRFRPLSHLTKICGAKAISWKRGASNETFGSDPPQSSSSLTPLASSESRRLGETCRRIGESAYRRFQSIINFVETSWS